MIPKVVYQDNGRAFRAKYFTDDKGFTELGFQGLYSKLGVETVFARPYNAKAKVIERFFKEFQESFEKLWPSYIGSNIQNKPAYMMRNEKLHKNWHNEYIPTIEETIKMTNMWLNFKNSQLFGIILGAVLTGGFTFFIDCYKSKREERIYLKRKREVLYQKMYDFSMRFEKDIRIKKCINMSKGTKDLWNEIQIESFLVNNQQWNAFMTCMKIYKII